MSVAPYAFELSLFCLVWFYGLSTIVGYLMPNPLLYIKTVPFQEIQFNINTQLKCQKTVLFKTIQFSICTLFRSIWPIDRVLLGTTTRGLSGSGSDDNKRILHILERSGITGASPSDFLVSFTGYLFVESHFSAKMQSLHFTLPANCVIVQSAKCNAGLVFCLF